MAQAFRQKDPEKIYIRVDGRMPAYKEIGRWHLTFPKARRAYPLPVEAINNNIITIEDIRFSVERMLRDNPESDIGLMYEENKEIIVSEQLDIHHSFFFPIVDYAIASCVPPYKSLGFSYTKPERLAVFTHVYDDPDMLKIWEKYYSTVTDHRHLYVIDHGSNVFPEDLNEKVNVVRIPRNGADHQNISLFCCHFQRFLLTQYEWVLHVDADELVACAGGLANYVENLPRGPAIIIAPAIAHDLVQNPDTEAELDMGRPLTHQRGHLVPAGYAYRKPVLASMPTTWGPGFHYALEPETVSDDRLWLIHLAMIDVGLEMAKSRKWNGVKQTEHDKRTVNHLHRTSTIEESESKLRDHLRGGSETLPDWLVGMF